MMALQQAQSEETLRQLQRQGDFKAQGIRDTGAAVSQGIKDISGAYKERAALDKEESRYQTEEGRAKEAHGANLKQMGATTAGAEMNNTRQRNVMQGEENVPGYYGKLAQTNLDVNAANLAATKAGTAGTYANIAVTKAEQGRIDRQKASDELDATMASIATINSQLTALGPENARNSAQIQELKTKGSGLQNYANQKAADAGLQAPALTVRGDKAAATLASNKKSQEASDEVIAQNAYPDAYGRVQTVEKEGVKLASMTDALNDFKSRNWITDDEGETSAFNKILALADTGDQAKLSERGGPFVGSKSERAKQYIEQKRDRLEMELAQLRAGSYGHSTPVIENRIKSAENQLASVNGYLKNGVTAGQRQQLQLKLKPGPQTQQVNYQGQPQVAPPSLR